MDVEYREIMQYVKEDIDECLNKDYYNKCATISYLMDAYCAPCGDVKKCAVYVNLGYLALTMRRIYIGTKNIIKSKLMELDMQFIKENVSVEEYEEITKSIAEILSNIDNIEISNFSARSCWEYEEINEEVEKFLATLNLGENTISETVALTLKRFEISCRFSRSEEICVYLALAEKLLQSVNSEELDNYNKLINFIKDFDLKSIKDEQFTVSEKEDLVKRINKIINDTKELIQ